MARDRHLTWLTPGSHKPSALRSNVPNESAEASGRPYASARVPSEWFTFASRTCNAQPRIHGLHIVGVFPSRVAATVHSLEAQAPGCPQATLALPRSEPQSGR